MSVSLNTSPPPVSLSLNDIIFKLSSDNLYSAVGSKAILELTFSSVASSGDKIIFDNGLEFTGAAAPDDSGLQFPTTANNIVDFTEGVAQAFQVNYYLSINYDIVYYFNSITITAKESGDVYNLALGSGYYAGMSGSATAGINSSIRDFFGILIELFYKNVGGDYYKFEEIYDVDANGEMEYNPKGFLAKGTDAFQFPATDTIIDRSSLLYQYYIRYAESYGVPQEIRKLTASNIFFALPGKVNKKMVQWLESKSISWMNFLNMNKNFLSVLPDISNITGWNDLIKLYYLTTEPDCSGINILADIYYHDGTSTLNENISSTQSDKYKLHEINIDLSNLNSNKNINYIDLFVQELKDQTSVFSAKKRFILDYKSYKHARYFIFKNTYGIYATFRTTGDSITETSIDFEILDIDEYAGTRNKNQSKSMNSLSTTVSASTGYFDNETLLPFILDFISSSDVFEINNNLVYPVIIDTKRIKLYDDNKSKYNISFKYEQLDNSIELPSIEGSFSFAFSNDFKII